MTDANLDQTLVMLDQAVDPDEREDVREAQALATRLGLPFDPLDEFHVDADLFRTIPVETMIHHQFLPTASDGEVLRVVMADPSDVVGLNELELALARPIEVTVSPGKRIADILDKSESTQRVLDEATEGFSMQIVQEDEDGEGVLSIDRITASPPCTVGMMETRKSMVRPENLTLKRPSCGTRFSAISSSDMTLIRLTMVEWWRLSMDFIAW
jgi:hypothetical protein